ncbi:glycan biosynthesis hexose transferase WsfD [Bacillus toyonensis]|uniref:glycan biosynthesis hexose transferase WsfD n=2 Tax=Bacillus toyonensis TaxID=155322 RepID=UPI002175C1F5|nr:hypothetical protein [Bacillus toyonensis]
MQTKWLKWEVIAVVVAAIVMIGLLLIKPIVGLADNGDFERIMIQIGLAYPDPNEARVDKYFSFIHHLYAYVNPAAGDYVSSQLFLMVPALWIGKILPGPWFDIRVLAVEYIMIFLLALYLIVKLNKTNNKIVNGFLVTLTIVVFADIGYILYFNSMYGEAVTYVFLFLTIALGIQLARQKHPSIWLVILFYISAIMLACSKTQYTPAGFIAALLTIRLWFIRKDKVWRSVIVSMTALLLILSFICYKSSPAWIDKINIYQTIFYGVLKDSPNPEQDLRDLGVDPELAVNAGTHFWSNAAIPQEDPRLHKELYNKIKFPDIAKFYLTHPQRFWSKLEATAEYAWTIRPSVDGVAFLGNYEKKDNPVPVAQVETFSLWSHVKEQYHPNGFIWIVLLYVLYGLGILLEYRRAKTHSERLIPDIFTAVAIIGMVSYVVPFVGSGEGDFAKHLFLFTVCLDVMLVSGIWWLAKGRLTMKK